MFQEAWQGYTYLILLIVWLITIAFRFVPALYERYPNLQKNAQWVGWGALIGIVCHHLYEVVRRSLMSHV